MLSSISCLLFVLQSVNGSLYLKTYLPLYFIYYIPCAYYHFFGINMLENPWFRELKELFESIGLAQLLKNEYKQSSHWNKTPFFNVSETVPEH